MKTLGELLDEERVKVRSQINGTLTSAYQEEERENLIKRHRERQGFEDTLKVRRDAREEAKGRREEGTAKSLTDVREARQLKIVQDVMKQANPELDANQVIAVERLVQREATALERTLGMTEPVKKEQLEKYRQSIEKRLLSTKQGRSTTQAPLPPKADDIRSYRGTKYRFKGGDNVESNWEAVP